MNLGRDLSTPGGYRVWMPSTKRLFVTSELYFEESWMPWRAKGDERVGEPLPHAPPEEDENTVDFPSGAPEVTKTTRKVTFDPEVIAKTSLPQAFDAATRGAHANARASKDILLLYSGPHRRPDSLAAFLSQQGFTSTLVDSCPNTGGGRQKTC